MISFGMQRVDDRRGAARATAAERESVSA
jgi:DHA1 family inner membrane transport protein